MMPFVKGDIRSFKHFNVIHYLTTPWDDTPGETPTPLVIGVLNLATNLRTTFSILQAAERAGIGASDIPSQMCNLERVMLEDFHTHLRNECRRRWLHWNMRDAMFGFEALAHRFAILGGSSTEISPQRRFNLAAILISAYTEKYSADPRLEKIAEKNNLSMLDYLTRTEEADAARAGHYQLLQRSVWRKIDIIVTMFRLFLTRSILHDGEEKEGCLLQHMRSPQKSPISRQPPTPTAIVERTTSGGWSIEDHPNAEIDSASESPDPKTNETSVPESGQLTAEDSDVSTTDQEIPKSPQAEPDLADGDPTEDPRPLLSGLIGSETVPTVETVFRLGRVLRHADLGHLIQKQAAPPMGGAYARALLLACYYDDQARRQSVERMLSEIERDRSWPGVKRWLARFAQLVAAEVAILDPENLDEQGTGASSDKSTKRRRTGGKPPLEKSNPLQFQVYQRIQQEHQPGAEHVATLGRLKDDKDFIEQVKAAGLKPNCGLVRKALALFDQRRRDQARKNQETGPA